MITVPLSSIYWCAEHCSKSSQASSHFSSQSSSVIIIPILQIRKMRLSEYHAQTSIASEGGAGIYKAHFIPQNLVLCSLFSDNLLLFQRDGLRPELFNVYKSHTEPSLTWRWPYYQSILRRARFLVIGFSLGMRLKMISSSGSQSVVPGPATSASRRGLAKKVNSQAPNQDQLNQNSGVKLCFNKSSS